MAPAIVTPTAIAGAACPQPEVDVLPYVQTVLAGADALAGATPDVLLEVPHAAWRRRHYDAVRAQVQGELPPDLEAFFHANTDEGAEALGLATAQALVEADSRRTVVVLACRVPRTFVDCNRLVDTAESDLLQGGVTAGLAPYVREPADQALLQALHHRYVQAATALVDAVCAGGGLVVQPHTYAPRSVGIAHITDRIAADMREAWAPGVAETWPLRPEVDLITVDPDGRRLADPELVDDLQQAWRDAGLQVVEGGTYSLHPATQSARFAARHPGRTLCFEVRRDLLIPGWRPFEEQCADPALVDRVAEPLAAALHRWLRARRPR